jgi:prophage regulatory protein
MSREIDRDSKLQAVSAKASLPRILRLKEVCRMTGLGRSCIYQLQADGRFPRRIKIGVRAVGWLEEDVRNWLLERIAKSRDDSVRS